MPPNEDSIAEGIVGAGAYEAPEPAKKAFLPWHKPRKQLVRAGQWVEQVLKMVSGRRPDENRLSYVGLPGADLLDLRTLHQEVCMKHDLGLRFLGFNRADNESDAAELNISLDEVKRLEKVDPLSDVIADDIAELASDDSIAWSRAVDLGPYDIVNLDLCDGIAAKPPAEVANTHYNALSRLMSLQSRRKGPWLLFITTLARPGTVHPDVLEPLLKKYVENLQHAPFLEASREHLALVDEAAVLASAATPAGHLQLFLCGLCKWLIGLAVAHRPPVKAEVTSVIAYRVLPSAEVEDMASVAILFTPTLSPLADALHLAQLKREEPSEPGIAVKALRRVAKRVDADKVLDEDPKLCEEMTKQTEELLLVARYDVAAYRPWLEQQGQSPKTEAGETT